MRRRRRLRTRTFRGDAVAWGALAVVVAVVVLTTWWWGHRRILEPADPDDGVREARFAVLAFGRVVESPDGVHLDRDRLSEHLSALDEQGFRPVTLRQLVAFLRGDGTLPKMSVLLTFDHGYLSTALTVDRILRERMWPAVLFLTTERLERRDSTFAYWPRVRRMVSSGIWEAAAHGHRGLSPVPTDSSGTEGPFFLHRMWRADVGRPESTAEYEERVAGDHEQAKRLLEEHLAPEVLAYAPPLGRAAIGSLEPGMRRVQAETVRSAYDVAFDDDLFGVNDREADPHHLRRLRVGPFWASAELVARLARALSLPGDERAAEAVSPRHWAPGAGRREIRGSEVVATGAGRADLWRAGSQWSRDWVLDTDLWMDGSQFWVVQSSADSTEEWRIGGDGRGMHLQRRHRDGTTETLASFPSPVASRRWHHLRLVRRGAGVWIGWNGRALSGRPVHLPGRWLGAVGCVSWGGAQVTVRLRNARFARFPYRTRALSARPTEDEVQAAIREAPGLAAVSPRWLRVGDRGLAESWLDRDLLRILSHRYGWEIVPTVRVQAAGTTTESWLPEALARSQAEGWSGLRLDLSRLPALQRHDVAAAAAAERETRRASWPGLRLVLEPGVSEGERAAGLPPLRSVR